MDQYVKNCTPFRFRGGYMSFYELHIPGGKVLHVFFSYFLENTDEKILI